MPRPSVILVALGVTAVLALIAVVALAPCDSHAAINSFDGTRAMAQPYRGIWLLLNVAAPILFGIGIGRSGDHLRFIAGVATWFVSGLLLYILTVWIWKSSCPGL